jgi:hypothetical protein
VTCKQQSAKPEAKCGAEICCDDPDCPDVRETFRTRAVEIWATDGHIELDDDARVSLSRKDDGTVRGAYVQAWVWVDARSEGD